MPSVGVAVKCALEAGSIQLHQTFWTWVGFLHLTYNIKATNINTRLQLTWELLVSIPMNQGLPSCIKMFRSLESLHIYLKNHLNTKTITIRDINFTHFTVLLPTFWQAGELTYGICEVVSFLTKSGVG